MIHFQNGQKFCTGTSQKYVTKHMKICSTSLVKREVQIKIKMRLFTFINIVKFKKMLILNIGQDLQQLEFSNTAGGHIKCHSYF